MSSSARPFKKRAPQCKEEGVTRANDGIPVGQLTNKEVFREEDAKKAALKHLRDRRFSPDGTAPKMTDEQRERKRLINRLSAQRKRQRERFTLDTLTDQYAKYARLNGALSADNDRLQALQKKMKSLYPAQKQGHAAAGLAHLSIMTKLDMLELMRSALVDAIETTEPPRIDALDPTAVAPPEPKPSEVSPFKSTTDFLTEKLRLLDAAKQVMLQGVTAQQQQPPATAQPAPAPPAIAPMQTQTPAAPPLVNGLSNDQILQLLGNVAGGNPPLPNPNNVGSPSMGQTTTSTPTPQLFNAQTLQALAGAGQQQQQFGPLSQPMQPSAAQQTQQPLQQQPQSLPPQQQPLQQQQPPQQQQFVPPPTAPPQLDANMLSLLLQQAVPIQHQMPNPAVSSNAIDPLLLQLLQSGQQMPQEQQQVQQQQQQQLPPQQQQQQVQQPPQMQLQQQQQAVPQQPAIQMLAPFQQTMAQAQAPLPMMPMSSQPTQQMNDLLQALLQESNRQQQQQQQQQQPHHQTQAPAPQTNN